MDIPIQRKILIREGEIRQIKEQIYSAKLDVETAEIIEDTEGKTRASDGIRRGLKVLKMKEEKLEKLKAELAAMDNQAEEV